MDGETLRSRIVQLAQKSRKALRLYQTMGRLGGNAESAELTDHQIEQWKAINADLLQDLSSALQEPTTRDLTTVVYHLRDRYHDLWRGAESKLHGLQRELVAAAEQGDFIKASLISRELVVLKARTQATQAAQHEIQAVLERSRVSPPATIALKESEIVEEQNLRTPEPSGKVIPLRKRS